MKKSLCKPTLFIPLLLLFVSVVYSTLALKKQEIKVAEPFSYKRVYSDSKGESHFANEEVLFKLADFAPPAPPVSVSDAINAEAVVFISSPSGWFGNWHPAPRRQFLFVISGELEVEVSDGEKCRFGSGSIILVEDTKGKGHISRLVSKERGYAIAVPLK